VLGYPLFALTQAQQADALAAYAASALHHRQAVPTEAAALPRCKDRDDQKFLELARDSAAHWLVTADKALLRLARRERLRGLFRILTPEAALAES
jgi:predicted nucleic acid-binding protein